MAKVASSRTRNRKGGRRRRSDGVGATAYSRESRPQQPDIVNGMQSGTGTIISLSVAVSILFGIVAVVLSISLSRRAVTNDDDDRRDKAGRTDRSSANANIDAFLRWFVRNGGYLNPAVTLAEFPDFGGYGLATASSSSSGGGGGGGVKRHDEMFRVPSRIIFTAESVLSSHVDGRNHGGAIRRRLLRQTRAGAGGGGDDQRRSLVRQDYAIALGLMVECSLGEASEFRPYLDVLPDDVPRLDTFSERELDMLQDEHLAALARDSASRLRAAWDDEGLGDLVIAMAASAAASNPTAKQTNHLRCLSFESFRRFVAIASSRAMVIRGTKYLVPMADMANYAPRNDGRKYGQSVNSFLTYHRLDHDTGTVTVHADRDVPVAADGGEQIFEDYGDVDNSLYLEAHGFVPDHNPFHCAVLDLPDVTRDLSDESRRVLVRLRVVKGEGGGVVPMTARDGDGGAVVTIVPSSVPNACVMADGTLTDDRATAYLAVYGMMDSGHSMGGDVVQDEETRRRRNNCLEASSGGDDAELAVLAACVRYAGHEVVVRREVERAARRALEDAPTTLDEDLALIREADADADRRRSGGDEESVGGGELLTTRGRIAVRFRIEEKKILSIFAKGRG